MIADITLREFIAGLFLAGGAFFLLASAIGMLRLPDFYCRLHASGNSETLGVMLSFMGLVIYEGLTLTSLKMIMIFLLIFLGNPIVPTSSVKRLINRGIMSGPWKRMQRRRRIMQIYLIEAILLVFLIVTTISVIFCKDILCAAVIYSAFSFCAVLLYLMMGAPDVAFTEAVIGTISTIYFVASLKKIDRWCK